MSEESLFSKTKAAVGAALLGPMREEHAFTELHQDGAHSWRIEPVPREHEGEPFLAERLVKYNDATGERVTIGEYDTRYAMADAAATLPDLPSPVRSQISTLALPERGEKSVSDLGIFRLPAMS